jgi:hypothetical protein
MLGWCLPFLTIAVINVSRGPAFTGIFPALLIVPIIALLVYLIRRNARYANAPTQTAPAIVVSRHSRGRGKFSSNHITLEFEDGRRQEYLIGPGAEAALVGVGDAGVAFTTLDVVVLFDRVP